MAYNYDDQIPDWTNEGTEPADSVKNEGFKAGYKPPAAYFNWFWSHTLKWLTDLRTKLSSLHTQVTSVESKIKTLEGKDYSVSASDILTKLKNVDGAESGLDADTLDGKQASDFADVNHTHSQYATASHNHAVATSSSNGFMSSTDKAKLDGIDLNNLTTYEHPSTHPASMITGLSGVAISGNYADLINKPILSAVATSNNYNDLSNKPAQYTHPSTHPATMIEETANVKMMTAAERTKLAGIAAGANAYTHPSTHPASMITGLADQMSTLGYNKVATGSYTGIGSATSYSAARSINLPFSPQAIILYSKSDRAMRFASTGQSIHAPTVTTQSPADLSGSTLKVWSISGSSNDISWDKAGYTYYYVIFA